MKKIAILFTLALFTVHYSLFANLSGQAKIDSLLNELPKAKNDTNKVNLLDWLSFEYHLINPDKGIDYGSKGLDLAKELNWKKGIAYNNNSLAANYWSKGNYHKALKYFRKALKINEELGNKSLIASNLSNIGLVYYNLSNYDKALKYHQKSMKINKELRNQLNIAGNLGNIGIVYQNLSEYDKALKYLHKALKINEELQNKRSIANNLGNIGIVYFNLSDYGNAIKYYQNALKINEELGNKSSITSNLSNIGAVYDNLSDYDKALKYYQKALKLNEELDNKGSIALNLGNIGLVYFNLSEYDKALKYYQKALKMDEELGNKDGISINLSNIGSLCFDLTQDTVISKIEGKSHEINLNKAFNLERSLEFLLKAAEIAEEIGAKNSLINIYNNLQAVFKEKGDYKKAYEYLLKQKSAEDSVFSVEKAKEINQMTNKYEREQKEKEAAIAAAKAAEELRYRNALQYAGIFLLIIILTITMFIIRKSNIKPGVVGASVFFTFLLFYEFVTVLIEPWADDVSNQEPLYKLGINIAVALLFIPLSRIEFKVRTRLSKN